MGSFRRSAVTGFSKKSRGWNQTPATSECCAISRRKFGKLPRLWSSSTDAPRTRRIMQTAQVGLNLRTCLVFASFCRSSGARNNPNLCFNWFVPADTTRGSGEAQSIRQMIDRTVADWDIDRDRFLSPASRRGAPWHLRCLPPIRRSSRVGRSSRGFPIGSASDIPAAFQVMADSRTLPADEWASIVRSASHHRGRWPKFRSGRERRITPSIPRNADEIVKQWTALHQTGAKPDQIEKHPGYVRRIWNNTEGEPAVEEYVVSAMGHGTPLATGSGEGHFGAAAPYLLETGLSSSHRIAQFWDLTKVPPARQPARDVGVPKRSGQSIKPVPQLPAITVPSPHRGPDPKPRHKAPSPLHD